MTNAIQFIDELSEQECATYQIPRPGPAAPPAPAPDITAPTVGEDLLLGVIQVRELCRLRRTSMPIRLRETTREIMLGNYALDFCEAVMLKDLLASGLTAIASNQQFIRRWHLEPHEDRC